MTKPTITNGVQQAAPAGHPNEFDGKLAHVIEQTTRWRDKPPQAEQPSRRDSEEADAEAYDMSFRARSAC